MHLFRNPELVGEDLAMNDPSANHRHLSVTRRDRKRKGERGWEWKNQMEDHREELFHLKKTDIVSEGISENQENCTGKLWLWDSEPTNV